MGFGIKKLVRLFESGNVDVTGEKGAGKDVMFGNVLSRIHRPYISNLDYTCDKRFIPLDLSKFDCGGNIYDDFTLLVDGKEAFPEIIKCINNAQKSIIVDMNQIAKMALPEKKIDKIIKQ